MPADTLKNLPGYDPDVPKSREEARAIMQQARLRPRQAADDQGDPTRDWSIYRDPAVLLIDQLKHIYIDGELETHRHAAILSEDPAQGLHRRPQPAAPPPGPTPTRSSTSLLRFGPNHTGYCNPEVDKLFAEQSREGDTESARNTRGRSIGS